MTAAPDQPHHVVIVGAGFGGLETAFGLAGAPVRITLIDRSNHHLFQPLLYQVATASLATSEIAWPVRYLLRDRKDVTTLFANVDNASRIAQEEIFGPVLCLIPADDEDHAIHLANDSNFGLNGSVLTNDVDAAYRKAGAASATSADGRTETSSGESSALRTRSSSPISQRKTAMRSTRIGDLGDQSVVLCRRPSSSKVWS